MKNASFIGNIHSNTNIYRIFAREYFFELFENRQNALVVPRMWSDPFENVFLRSPVKFFSDGEIGTFGFRDDLYGQCWTGNQCQKRFGKFILGTSLGCV